MVVREASLTRHVYVRRDVVCQDALAIGVGRTMSCLGDPGRVSTRVVRGGSTNRPLPPFSQPTRPLIQRPLELEEKANEPRRPRDPPRGRYFRVVCLVEGRCSDVGAWRRGPSSPSGVQSSWRGKGLGRTLEGRGQRRAG